MGKFTGLNIHSFSTIKGFMEILLAISAHYLVQLKRGADIHKNFCDTPEMCKKCESLAQQIFPHLWYSLFLKLVLQKYCM